MRALFLAAAFAAAAASAAFAQAPAPRPAATQPAIKPATIAPRPVVAPQPTGPSPMDTSVVPGESMDARAARGTAVWFATYDRVLAAGCTPNSETATFPSTFYDTRVSSIVPAVGTTVFSVTNWTGGCAGGKRDGAGALTLRVESVSPYKHDSVTVEEGFFIAGKRIGLWCVTSVLYNGKAADTTYGDQRACRLRTPANASGLYRKMADGRWRYLLNQGGKEDPADPIFPAGALEGKSQAMIAAARAKKPIADPDMPVRVAALDGLVTGGRTAFATRERYVKPNYAGARVALVFSSGALAELERFKRERQAFLDANASEPWDAKRTDFLAKSDPKRLLTSIVTGMRGQIGAVAPAKDLSVLRNGGADYALVADWRYKARFDLNEKSYDELLPCSYPYPPACLIFSQSATYYLLGPDMKIVKVFQAPGAASGAKSSASDAKYKFHLIDRLNSAFDSEFHRDASIGSSIKSNLSY